MGKPESERPVAPAWLSDDERLVFDELDDRLAGLPEYLPAADAPMMAVGAQAFCEFRRADAIVAAEGLTVVHVNKLGHPNTVPHPALRTRDAALRRWRDCLDALLLSPKSRRRVGRPVRQPDDDDPDGFGQFVQPIEKWRHGV